MASSRFTRPQGHTISNTSSSTRNTSSDNEDTSNIKQESSDDDTEPRPSSQSWNSSIHPVTTDHRPPTSSSQPPSPSTDQGHQHRRVDRTTGRSRVTMSQGPCSFADIAYAYRLYILDDLLAEPQEIVHDYMRNVIYISQRYRQGNSVAPIELSHEVWVMDINTAEITSTIDTLPYVGPHCLELHDSGTFIYANVEHGGSICIDPDTGMVYDAQLAGGGTDGGDQAHFYSSPASSTSTHSYRGGSSSRGGGRLSSSGSSSGGGAGRDDFIAEIDLRSGKMRRRVNVPRSDSAANDGRHLAFSAPAIRFAGRSSSSGMPVVHVEGDPAIEAIKARFGAKRIYATSRNIMLV
ncbi:uncharacterized protein B0I36DRAFT_388438, partial [Microdochium trichocladiopsis]